MEENKPTQNENPVVPTTPVAPAPQPPETKKPENTPEYPKNEATSSNGKVDAKAIVRAVIIILIIGLGIWFFNRGAKPADNSDQGNNTNIVVDDTRQEGQITIGEQKKDDGTPVGQDTTKIKITAFYSKQGDTNCSAVYSLEREIGKKYDDETINTVRGLLTPLTATEKETGYISNIPLGVYLKNIFVAGDGTATIKFSDDLNKVTGTCAISAARAQIESTLKQFSYVKSVVICINDNCNQAEVLPQ